MSRYIWLISCCFFVAGPRDQAFGSQRLSKSEDFNSTPSDWYEVAKCLKAYNLNPPRLRIKGNPNDPANYWSAYNKQIEQIMRLLEATPTSVLRKAIHMMVYCLDPRRSEKKEFTLLMKRLHPRWGPVEIHDEGTAFFVSTDMFFWIDRFLFVAPDREKRSDPYDKVENPDQRGEYIDRMFPVAIDTHGHFYIKSHDSGPAVDSISRTTHEFDYYSTHYKRRSRWW